MCYSYLETCSGTYINFDEALRCSFGFRFGSALAVLRADNFAFTQDERNDFFGAQLLVPVWCVSIRRPCDDPGFSFTCSSTAMAAFIDVTVIGGDNDEPFFVECFVASGDEVGEVFDVGIDADDCLTVEVSLQSVDMAGIVNVATVRKAHIKRAS